ncbi:MAG: flagellar type III secretion system pore protein FliP [Planctomycetota bacterium]
MPSRFLLAILGIAILAPAFWAGSAVAEESTGQVQPIEIKLGEDGQAPRVSATLGMLATMTALAFIPMLLVMTTSFARIIIVLGFLRQALSTQQTPPNIVLIGISLFLTVFIMGPVFDRMHRDGLDPYLKGKATPTEALQKGLKPLREFMAQQTHKKDLALTLELSHAGQPRDLDDVPTTTLIPAFMLSELRTAFQMGFLLFLPFLVIDLVVGSVLLSMGMIMLPPVMISLPLKLLLFVLADGWYLVVRSLVASFAASG